MSTISCHRCGNDNSVDFSFCPYCGVVLKLQAASTTQVLVPSTTQSNATIEQLVEEASIVCTHLTIAAHRLLALHNARIEERATLDNEAALSL